MDKEDFENIREMANIILGNTYETISKEDYKKLESLALWIGHMPEILNPHLQNQEETRIEENQLLPEAWKWIFSEKMNDWVIDDGSGELKHWNEFNLENDLASFYNKGGFQRHKQKDPMPENLPDLIQYLWGDGIITFGEKHEEYFIIENGIIGWKPHYENYDENKGQKMTEDAKETIKFAIFNSLVGHCGEILTTDKIESIRDEIFDELENGACSWVFNSEEKENE